MTIPPVSRTTGQQSTPGTMTVTGWIDSAFGPLSARELGALRKAVGYDFTWPPTATSMYPLAAVEVAGRHAQQLASGIRAQELTAHSLMQLAAAGFLDAQGAARGSAYLQGGSTDDATPAPATPASGTIGADGSRYL